jgi:hypothetical protein
LGGKSAESDVKRGVYKKGQASTPMLAFFMPEFGGI